MGMNIPMPQEAKDALARVGEMHDNLSAIRELLQTLVDQNALLISAFIDDEEPEPQPAKVLRLRRVGEPHAAFTDPTENRRRGDTRDAMRR